MYSISCFFNGSFNLNGICSTQNMWASIKPAPASVYIFCTCTWSFIHVWEICYDFLFLMGDERQNLIRLGKSTTLAEKKSPDTKQSVFGSMFASSLSLCLLSVPAWVASGWGLYLAVGHMYVCRQRRLGSWGWKGQMLGLNEWGGFWAGRVKLFAVFKGILVRVVVLHEIIKKKKTLPF